MAVWVQRDISTSASPTVGQGCAIFLCSGDKCCHYKWGWGRSSYIFPFSGYPSRPRTTPQGMPAILRSLRAYPFSKKIMSQKLDWAGPTCYLRTHEAEAGRLYVVGYPGLHNKYQASLGYIAGPCLKMTELPHRGLKASCSNLVLCAIGSLVYLKQLVLARHLGL